MPYRNIHAEQTGNKMWTVTALLGGDPDPQRHWAAYTRRRAYIGQQVRATVTLKTLDVRDVDAAKNALDEHLVRSDDRPGEIFVKAMASISFAPQRGETIENPASPYGHELSGPFVLLELMPVPAN